MVLSIIHAITTAIHSAFGESFEIYTQPISQGLKLPCFVVLSQNPTLERFRSNRYFSQNQFCIQFFPSHKNKHAQCDEVLQRLCHTLEVLVISGNLTRGTNFSSERKDGVLVVTCNYDMFLDVVPSVNLMGEYQLDTTQI